MNNTSEVKMEQLVVGVVAVVIAVCATFLGVKKDVDTTTVLTSIATGLFGYAGMATRKDKDEEPPKTDD